MSATVISLRVPPWLGCLSNKALIDRFCAAIEACDDAACAVLNHGIERRHEAGTLGDDDWRVT